MNTLEADRPTAGVAEDEWEKLLARIESGKVIPVIGDGLSIVSSGQTETTLSEWLAQALRKELGVPDSEQSLRWLHDVAAWQFKRRPDTIEDVYVSIFQLLKKSSFAVPRTLEKLAAIRDFKLFVSTTFDPYLKHALNEVRYGRRQSQSTRTLAYQWNRAVDIPDDYVNLTHPIVYHLFGEAQASPLFAVTDEDVLEWMHQLQATERQPQNLFVALRERPLLVLGSRLPGWLARFFLRISSRDRLLKESRAHYFVDPTGFADRDQAHFFENFVRGAKVFPISCTSFIDELHTRWIARHPEAVATSSRISTGGVGRGFVFLSYAHEDSAIAAIVRERIERELGIDVWLDKQSLRGGDAWNSKIRDALRGCAACVPIISQNVRSGTYRFVRVEWSEAIELQKGRVAGARFIVPLAADETSGSDETIPSEIRQLHWRRFLDEADMKAFLEDVRNAVHAAAGGR